MPLSSLKIFTPFSILRVPTHYGGIGLQMGYIPLHRSIAFLLLEGLYAAFLLSYGSVNSVSIFGWLCCNYKLLTRDRLIRHGMQSDANCLLCNRGLESHWHIFGNCVYALEGWRHFLQGIGMTWFPLSWTSWNRDNVPISQHRLRFSMGVFSTFQWKVIQKSSHQSHNQQNSRIKAANAATAAAEQRLRIASVRCSGTDAQQRQRTRCCDPHRCCEGGREGGRKIIPRQLRFR
ncbi:hypothetical protein Cni_G16182 [Canna indica]|uniref:Reverse transcriptase zinc-binding domain-containing protein n=1 Tax=Canna indica TaxID=4628 RepID=A0AAQ3QFF3_9LILI|nr:hypothetical protein Cni_G16182 [Canna indica]